MLVRGQQDMTDAQFEAFSKRFGELDPPPNQGVGKKNVPGHPDLYVVSNELGEKGEPLGALGYSEAVWHTDMSYLPVPPIASMLLSRKLPAWGGNTWAASMVAAYENLPRRAQGAREDAQDQARRHARLGRQRAQGREGRSESARPPRAIRIRP